MVDHQMLQNKLEFLGMRGIALEWIRSYVVDRKQFVEIPFMDCNGRLCKCRSSELVVKVGVPQGVGSGPSFISAFY